MKSCKLILPALLLLALSVPAKAHDGLGGLGLAYLYGYGGGCNFGATSYNRSLPYFALHPPVYYGQRYARPYGASPFAAWPQLQANPAYIPTRPVVRSTRAPQVIHNPYATGAATPASNGIVEVKVPKVSPLVIENPYFQSSEVRYTAKKQ